MKKGNEKLFLNFNSSYNMTFSGWTRQEGNLKSIFFESSFNFTFRGICYQYPIFRPYVPEIMLKTSSVHISGLFIRSESIKINKVEASFQGY